MRTVGASNTLELLFLFKLILFVSYHMAPIIWFVFPMLLGFFRTRKSFIIMIIMLILQVYCMAIAVVAREEEGFTLYNVWIRHYIDIIFTIMGVTATGTIEWLAGYWVSNKLRSRTVKKEERISLGEVSLFLLMLYSVVLALTLIMWVYYHGHTTLRDAIIAQNMDEIRWHIEQGEDLSWPNCGSNLLLGTAAETGNKDVCRLLIANGARISCTSGLKRVLLALESFDLSDIILPEVLRWAIASPDRRNMLFVLKYFREQEDASDFRKRLLQRNDAPKYYEGALALACFADDAEMIEVLLSKGANLHYAFPDGSTLLHDVCWSGSARALKVLVENGIDVNAQNDDGNCPIHIACAKGNFDIVCYLVENGADINVVNKKGLTPADIAQRVRASDMADFLRGRTDTCSPVRIPVSDGVDFSK